MIMGRKMMRATNEKSMPPMVPMAKANQNTSSLPSIRNGASPRTVERMVSDIGMILWLYARTKLRWRSGILLYSLTM